MKPISVFLALSAIVTGLATFVDRGVTEPNRQAQGAVLLQTQPISVNQPIVTSVSNASYTRENLNSISASIQSRPQDVTATLTRPSFIPRGLETGPAPATSVNPLEFFRVQAPDRGVRFRVSDTP